jgi:hypothetical protein
MIPESDIQSHLGSLSLNQIESNSQYVNIFIWNVITFIFSYGKKVIHAEEVRQRYVVTE